MSSDDDKTTLFLVGMFALGTGGAAALWGRVLEVLLRHAVIVPADEDVTLALPRADGAGLDLPRLLLLVAMALLTTGLLMQRRRAKARRSTRERQTRGHEG